MRIPQATDERLSSRDRRHLLRRTWRLLAPYRRRVALAGTLVVVQAGGMLSGPLLVRWGIDSGVRRGDVHTIDVATALFLVAALAAYAAGRGAIRTITWIGESFLRDLREQVFAHEMGLSLEFFDRHRTGTLVSRLTADVEALQELVGQGLSLFVTNALLLSGAVVFMLLLSWQLALGTLVVVPVVAKAAVWFRRESNRAYLELRDRIGTTLSSLQEGLSGVRVVQAFRREPEFADRFDAVSEAQFRANLDAERVAALFFPLVELARGLAFAVILGLGGWLVSRDAVTVGTVAAFVLYLQNLFEPVQQLSQLFNTLQAAGAALHKLFGVLDEEATVAERPGALDLPERGALEVDAVSFSYGRGTSPVLRDVSVAVSPGERLAIVGPTGAGKSTLAKLMVRFYDPTGGSVRFAGVDLRDATLASLRRRIVVIPQEGFLFHGTIRDNVLLSHPGADDGDIGRAIRRLGLEARFARFARGLDTEVGERGAGFSAGERQLVSLIRAALVDPAVVVLDEATSSLDPGTELLVEHALETLMKGRTVVVIAHRLSTAARADRVVVVDGGRVVEEGVHEELVARGGRYAALFASWAGVAGAPGA